MNNGWMLNIFNGSQSMMHSETGVFTLQKLPNKFISLVVTAQADMITHHTSAGRLRDFAWCLIWCALIVHIVTEVLPK